MESNIIKTVLENYGIKNMISYKKVERNSNLQPCFIIMTKNCKYFLKQYEKSKFKIAKRGFKLLHFLEEKKYPSVKLFRTIKGSSFVNYNKTSFTLWEFIKEKEKEQDKINYQEAYELGKYLGKLHKITKRYYMREAKGYSRYKKMFKESYSFLSVAPPKAKEVLEFIKNNFDGLKVPTNQPKAVCHEEYSVQHVRFKNNKLTKVIDWDGAGRDYLFYDLGLTLTMAIKNCKIDYKMLNKIIKGYQNQRKLTKWEKEHIFECVLFGAIKYFDWGNGKEELERDGWNWDTINLVDVLIKNEKDFYKNLNPNLRKCGER